MSEWVHSPLGELAEISSGGTPSRGNADYWGGDVPWVTPTDITNCKTNYIRETEDSITQKGLASSSAKLLPKGSLLLTSRATIGELKIAGKKMATNQGFKNLVPSGIDGDFLFYQCQMQRGQFLRFAAGSTFQEINRKDTARISIPHPVSSVAQKKIAAVLKNTDQAIEKTEALIEKYQQIKAGLMHDLFTRGIGPDGKLRPPRDQAPELYQETPIGWIPKEWHVPKLSDLCAHEITYGIVQAGPPLEDGIPYIRTGDMAGDRLEIGRMLRTSRKIADAFRRSEVKAGEIVCAIRATVGKVLPVPDELDGANLTQGTARIAPQPHVSTRFVLWGFRSSFVQKAIQLSIKGTTFSEITLADLRLLKFPTPDSEFEQEQIAAKLDSQEGLILCERQALEKLRRQKAGLMHDLLTGKVQVNADPPEASHV